MQEYTGLTYLTMPRNWHSVNGAWQRARQRLRSHAYGFADYDGGHLVAQVRMLLCGVPFPSNVDRDVAESELMNLLADHLPASRNPHIDNRLWAYLGSVAESLPLMHRWAEEIDLSDPRAVVTLYGR